MRDWTKIVVGIEEDTDLIIFRGKTNQILVFNVRRLDD